MIKYYVKQNLPPGHGWLLQVWDSESKLVELQFLPPWDGVGLVQVLVCVWFPPPQVKLQEPHGDQSDQFPSEHTKQEMLEEKSKVVFWNQNWILSPN